MNGSSTPLLTVNTWLLWRMHYYKAFLCASSLQCDLSCRYFFQFLISLNFQFSSSIFSVIVIVVKSYPLTNESISITVNLNHTVTTVCVIAGIMQTNCTTQAVRPRLKIFYDVWLQIYCTCVGVCLSTSCTRHLLVQCRQRFYNENWNNIYSVSVVNFSVPFCFHFSRFCYR